MVNSKAEETDASNVGDVALSKELLDVAMNEATVEAKRWKHSAEDVADAAQDVTAEAWQKRHEMSRPQLVEFIQRRVRTWLRAQRKHRVSPHGSMLAMLPSRHAEALCQDLEFYHGLVENLLELGVRDAAQWKSLWDTGTAFIWKHAARATEDAGVKATVIPEHLQVPFDERRIPVRMAPLGPKMRRALEHQTKSGALDLEGRWRVRQWRIEATARNWTAQLLRAHSFDPRVMDILEDRRRNRETALIAKYVGRGHAGEARHPAFRRASRSAKPAQR